jgi:hypothetical protein
MMGSKMMANVTPMMKGKKVVASCLEKKIRMTAVRMNRINRLGVKSSRKKLTR